MIISSIRQLAIELGVSHTTIRNYLSHGRIKEEPGGGFDLDKVKKALSRNADISQPTAEAKQQEPDSPDLGAGLSSHEMFNRARAAKEIAIAKERQYDLKLRQGELLEAKDVERVWTKALTAFRNRLMLVPDNLAGRVAACADVLECRDLIDREIRDVLRSLSEPEGNAD